MDELFGPLISPLFPISNLRSRDLKLEISDTYSSVFLRLAALLGFDAAFPDFFSPFASFFGAATFFAPASTLGATRLARGSAAAPPRFARWLTAGVAAPHLPVLF